MLALSIVWRRYLLFWVGAIAVGYIAVGFAVSATQAQALFGRLVAWSPYWSLLVTPLGIAFSAWIARRFFPGSQGSGIPQSIAARRFDDRSSLERLLSLRIAFGKILLTLLGLSVGASIGREGPTVQVGASILVWLSYRTGMGRQRGLILAGGAAGIAAAFNTPLAGVVFAIEEMSRAFERSISSLVLVAVILAGIAAVSVLGTQSYFGETNASLTGWHDWFAIPIAAAVGGLLGGIFSRLVVWTSRSLPAAFGGLTARHPIGFAAACGFAVAVLGILSGGATYGTGYESARAALSGTLGHPSLFAPAKFVATIVSIASGIPGGLFSPSLSIGAGLGAALAGLVPAAPPGTVALLTMVGFFSGVVQAPITGFVIVAEMTGDQAMIVPLMATALVATAVSKSIAREPVYHALAADFERRLARGPIAGSTSA